MTPRREIARIAVPVSLEFVIMLVMNFVNQVIVGGLGTVAIAAVGFANSLGFILFVTVGAVGASTAILAARAFGSGKRDDMDATVTTAISLAIAIAAPFVLAAFLWTLQVLELAGASPEVAAEGSSYFRISILAMIPGIVAAVLSGLMRSTGFPKVPMYVTVVTVVLDSVIAYSLVYGVGPLPKLGVLGAGIAVLTANALKLIVLGYLAFGRLDLVSWHFPRHRHSVRTIVRPLIVLAIPLGITELFWTLGIFLYNVIFQRLGNDSLAAAQIVATLEGVFIVGSVGLMSASTALIGKAIGEGDAPAARAWISRVGRAGLVTGVVFGGIYALSALAIPVLFTEVSDEVIRVATIGIVINGIIQAVKVRNMIVGAGVLPSGNDVKGVILGDVFSTFVVGLPLALFLGLSTPLLAIGIFLARVVEEVVKLGIFSWRQSRVNWDALAAEHGAVTV
ncbi:MAG: hypothetical protein RL205_1508 [Actinomycetota bacterium]|jgi:putative MATE family efflux protein